MQHEGGPCAAAGLIHHKGLCMHCWAPQPPKLHQTCTCTSRIALHNSCCAACSVLHHHLRAFNPPCWRSGPPSTPRRLLAPALPHHHALAEALLKSGPA
jgi:hypothetical protein